MSGRILVVALCAALSACSGGPSGTDRGSVQDSAGVRVIHLGAVEDSPPVTPLPLDESWHSLAGSEGNLVDVRAFSDGRLAALDRMSAAVVVLSAVGTPTAWIGAPGEGPGELSSGGLTRILVTDSSITVPDLFQQRISEFSLTGELASTSPFPGVAATRSIGNGEERVRSRIDCCIPTAMSLSGRPQG